MKTFLKLIAAISLGLASAHGAAPLYQFTNNATGFSLYGGTTSAATLTVTGTITLTGSATVTVSNLVFAGGNYGFGALTASSLTASGTINAGTLTSSGDVNATSGTMRTSAFQASGDAQFGGSNVSISSATITLSGITNTGAADFLGYTSDRTVVELTSVDAASLLGLPSSRTVKEAITPMSGAEAASLLGKIDVVHYRYTAASGQDATKPHIGFIAEDVAKVFPEGGNTVGPKTKLVPSVSDRDLLALLFAVVQEQQRQIDKLSTTK
jgi:hypothetical protein